MDATEIASRSQKFDSRCGAERPELASRLTLRAVDAGVPLEVLLRDPVEGERGDRALQERGRHAPCAAGAAPAAEVVAVDPDQVFVHGNLPLRIGIGVQTVMGNLPRNSQAAKCQRCFAAAHRRAKAEDVRMPGATRWREFCVSRSRVFHGVQDADSAWFLTEEGTQSVVS